MDAGINNPVNIPPYILNDAKYVKVKGYEDYLKEKEQADKEWEEKYPDEEKPRLARDPLWELDKTHFENYPANWPNDKMTEKYGSMSDKES